MNKTTRRTEVESACVRGYLCDDFAFGLADEIDTMRLKLAKMESALDSFNGIAPCGHEWKFTDSRGDEFQECVQCIRDVAEAKLAELKAANNELRALNVAGKTLADWQEMEKERDEAEASNEALNVKLDALAPHGSCACDYDRPGDVCGHHSPKLMVSEARCRRLTQALERIAKGFEGASPEYILATAEEPLATLIAVEALAAEGGG